MMASTTTTPTSLRTTIAPASSISTAPMARNADERSVRPRLEQSRHRRHGPHRRRSQRHRRGRRGLRRDADRVSYRSERRSDLRRKRRQRHPQRRRRMAPTPSTSASPIPACSTPGRRRARSPGSHQAIDHAVDTGRGGLGTILTKSAGNAREWGTDASALSFNGNTAPGGRRRGRPERIRLGLQQSRRLGAGLRLRFSSRCRHARSLGQCRVERIPTS